MSWPALFSGSSSASAEIVRGHRADRAGVEQVPRHRANGEAALHAVGALQDLVEQIHEHAILALVLARRRRRP